MKCVEYKTIYIGICKNIMKLFLKRGNIDCAYIFSLLNYNNLNFELFVEERLRSLYVVKKEVPDATSLPLLSFNGKNYEGSQAIMRQLSVSIQKGRSHSAWENLGQEFVRDEITPRLDIASSSFMTKFRMSYDNMSKKTYSS